MIKVPLPVLGVYHISEQPFRVCFGPISDFLPFAIMSLARAFQGIGEWTKPLLGMRIGSCVSGWKSPVFLDVPFGAIPNAPEVISPASPIIVQGNDPCEFWLEAETEEGRRLLGRESRKAARRWCSTSFRFARCTR